MGYVFFWVMNTMDLLDYPWVLGLACILMLWRYGRRPGPSPRTPARAWLWAIAVLELSIGLPDAMCAALNLVLAAVPDRWGGDYHRGRRS
jgi:hypothetical protein